MNHFYVSIGPKHEKYEYIGFVAFTNSNEEKRYRYAFEQHGRSGLPTGTANREMGKGPFKVIQMVDYGGERLSGDWHPQPVKYYPKLVILTKRDELGEIRQVIASRETTEEEEEKYRVYAITHGYVFHTFKPGDPNAWENVLGTHEAREND